MAKLSAITVIGIVVMLAGAVVTVSATLGYLRVYAIAPIITVFSPTSGTAVTGTNYSPAVSNPASGLVPDGAYASFATAFQTAPTVIVFPADAAYTYSLSLPSGGTVTKIELGALHFEWNQQPLPVLSLLLSSVNGPSISLPTNAIASNSNCVTAVGQGTTPRQDWIDVTSNSVAFAAVSAAVGGTSPFTLIYQDSSGTLPAAQMVSAISCLDWIPIRVTFTPYPLVASFVYSPLGPTAGQSVTFTPTVSGGTTPYTYLWTVNSQSYSVQSPTVTFASAGNYTAILSITDAQSNKVNATQTVRVLAVIGPLQAAFTFSGSVQAGNIANFTATAGGGTTPYSYMWNFGDSTSQTGGPGMTHTFQTAGTYTVSLTVTDSSAPVKTVTANNMVTVIAKSGGGTPPPTGSPSYTNPPNPPASASPVSFPVLSLFQIIGLGIIGVGGLVTGGGYYLEEKK
jgi:PKD repeat protein